MIRDITIQPVLNGFVCQIGCQRVVFNSTKAMTKEIERYYTNPDKVEREYRKNAVNRVDYQLAVAPHPAANVGRRETLQDVVRSVAGAETEPLANCPR